MNGSHEVPGGRQRFGISLGQYSLHRKIGGGGSLPVRLAKRLKYAIRERPADLFQGFLDPMQFAEFTRTQFDIDAVEYVSGFYPGCAENARSVSELRRRADDVGVRSVLILVDNEGALGAPDEAGRVQAVERHKKWVDMAAALGCHAIRVLTLSDPELGGDEQAKLMADGLARLLDYARPKGINLVIENKDGLSWNGAWLAGLMRLVDDPMLGTLPDFGSFRGSGGEEYDPLKGMRELMPFAMGVDAKAFDFGPAGEECTLDFNGMMKVVCESDFRGYIALEFEGAGMSEVDGIRRTKELVEKLIAPYQG